MKKNNFYLAAIAMAFVFASCEKNPETITTLVDFEDVKLNSDSISNTSGFISGNFTFNINDGAFWNGGIVCSAKYDTITSGYENQYSSIAASGAFKSKHFAVVYSPGSIVCPTSINGEYSIKSVMVTNSTYAYLDMKKGSAFGKKFATGDWFKVIIKGFKAKVQTSSVDVFLADFRNGKSDILKTWQKVDISTLGQIDSVAFNFDSSDKSGSWLNTPAYVCIDNIEFTQTISTK
jgi:hypothetical protein